MIPTPTSTPREAVLPHKYLIHIKSQHCQCCGAKHEWSELYSVASLRGATHLRRLDSPQYNLPIEKRQDPTKEIPFCHSCYHPTLDVFSHLPTGAIFGGSAPGPTLEAALGLRAEAPKAKPTTPPRRSMTAHDLLTLMQRGRAPR